MIIEFTIKNIFSFNEEVTLSMLASRDKKNEIINTIPIDKNHRVLKTSIIIGANASGKSNLIRALWLMKEIIVNQEKKKRFENIACFNFCSLNKDMPSLFEVVFFIDDIRYRYGFEIKNKEIISEWLFSTSNNREAKVFVREHDNIDLGKSFKIGKNEVDNINRDRLFLSALSQKNEIISKSIVEWFSKLNVLAGIDDCYSKDVLQIIGNTTYQKEKEKLIEVLNLYDFGIHDMKLSLNNSVHDCDNTLSEIEIYYKILQNNKYEVSGPYNYNILSEGTRKLINLLSAIIISTIESNIIVVDNIDLNLHTILLQDIQKLFLYNYFRPSKSQMIITTHNTNLLSLNVLRTDQFWLLEKDKYGSSNLFSLVEFNETVTNNSVLEKNYLNGRYGGIPNVN